MAKEDFKTRTENEYLRRTHSLTVKVMAFAFAALVLIASIFAGTIYMVVSEQTKQIQTIFQSQIEIETTTTREIKQDAETQGDASPVNQKVGK